MKKIIIQKPFDAHVHLRQGGMMHDVLPYTARYFAGGVAMGNLPGDAVIDNLEKHASYVRQIAALSPSFKAVVPLMVTKKLLENEGVVADAVVKGIHVFKFIPGGLSTNGAEGLTLYDFYSHPFRHFLKQLEDYRGIFSCHFEVGTDLIFDNKEIRPANQEKEAVRFLKYLLETFPRLKIVVEHASSADMIDFIESLPETYAVGATLTTHHALKHHGHIDPLHCCKPCIKTPNDNNAIRLAMCSGSWRFFAGTDSAPHLLGAKMRSENPAFGIFSAPVALQTYAEIFDDLGRLNHLNDFTSVFGPQFYGIAPSKEKITLIKRQSIVPATIDGIPVFRGGKTIPWSIAN